MLRSGLRLAFLTLLFCCCGSCKAFTALGFVRVEFQTSAVPDLLQLVNAYVMTSREPPLNTAACRLLLDIMPGLETAVVFQEKVSTCNKAWGLSWLYFVLPARFPKGETSKKPY